MKAVNITVQMDARKFNALDEAYEGTIHGFIEHSLEELYEETVLPQDIEKIESDIKIEKQEHSKDKFALICMKDKSNEFYIMTDDCKTFLDVATRFALDVYNDYPEWSIDNFKSSFGDYDEINQMAFNILSESCGRDKRIGVVAVFNMDENDNTLAIKTSENPAIRVFDLDNLYRATTNTINRDHDFYCDQLNEFDEQLGSYEAEIHIEEQGENEDSGMQM